ncbi:MAG: catalase family protein [Pseudomonadota bacterium]|nr:catalase family protein [Pseudomonadota bacterium]
MRTALGLGLLALLALAPRPAAPAAPRTPDEAPLAIDAELGEVAWPGEAALATRIAEALEREIERRYPPEDRPARRDVHAKAHGCARAELQVDAALDPGLAAGVFTPGARYPAWVRFSNGSTKPDRPDARGDVRGVAIKLLDVPGEKLLSTERDARTQDFLLISHPVFFNADPVKYARLIERGASRNPLMKLAAPLALGWKGLGIVSAMSSLRIASPLEVRYWSTVPFQHGIGPGRRAAKYSVRPCEPGTSTIPDHPSPDYLHDALATTLRTANACFDFLLQVRTSDAMSVEDPRTEWPEAEAPFVKVARLVLPIQELAPAPFCEDLSFTPWHALPEHRPLGGVNRIRRVVYEAISTFRHDLNGVERTEPS